jgi:hypothetical protein
VWSLALTGSCDMPLGYFSRMQTISCSWISSQNHVLLANPSAVRHVLMSKVFISDHFPLIRWSLAKHWNISSLLVCLLFYYLATGLVEAQEDIITVSTFACLLSRKVACL